MTISRRTILKKAVKKQFKPVVHPDGMHVDKKSGVTRFYKDNKLHNEHGPAVIETFKKGKFGMNRIGSFTYCLEGKVTREHGPAVIYLNGDVEYWKDGVMSNDHGPAKVLHDESFVYMKNGRLHREDGPARYTFQNNITEYFTDGMLDRKDGPAYTKDPEGVEDKAPVEAYYTKGKLNREDGPAAIFADGTQEFYKMNVLHNTEGPAIISPKGNLFFVDGEQYECDSVDKLRRMIALAGLNF